ncbi:DUF58 domain-containing protein [Virgibacillus profundi]|uniref:DUF58 domain-containing protein n=1 Tax=Virgibacillus profundi TaxID=2024555 RepID=A0A2A2I9A9_9BACI|nr:DUF58 domain-containing protein [Virgibacillus profundi]PXY52758.1 DUF58 domain-containing protein [Virgibacillus profundi]
MPARRLLIIYLLLSVALLLLSLADISWVFLISVNVLFILASLFDLLFLPKRSQIKTIRHVADEMERGLGYQTEIEFSNTSAYPITFRIIDDLPQSFHQNFPIMGFAKANSVSRLNYETTATVRGKYELQKLYIRYASRFGLWEKQMAVRQADTVKVIPDLSETRRYLENAQAFLLYEGAKIRKYQSGTGEFSRIRNYVVGDDPRKINWRQTAKLQEVMTNEYEPEHGKYITILIDCGRMMGAELKKGNRLEKTLEASITVVTAALKNGDYVGVLAFSNDIKVFVPPAKGMDQLQKILQSIYHLQADARESNYAGVMSYLQTVQKKRSLILLFSDIHTFLHEESTLHYIKRLRQKHLFLMIGIEDEALARETKQYPATVKQGMRKSIAQQQMQVKRLEKAKWEAQGLVMIEAKKEKLATEAVSQVIHWMNQGLL